MRELRERKDLRKALAEELLPELLRDRRLRLSIPTALYRDIATKQDLRELREELGKEFKAEFSPLRGEARELEHRINALEHHVNNLEQRVASVGGQLDLLVKVFIALNLPILIALIGILLKMVLGVS